MNERLQRTGKYRTIDLGNGVERRLEYYDVLSDNLRDTITTVLGISEAITILESVVKQERLACSTGGCED